MYIMNCISNKMLTKMKGTADCFEWVSIKLLNWLLAKFSYIMM